MTEHHTEKTFQLNLSMETLANRHEICAQICRSFNCDELRSIYHTLDVTYETLPGRTCRQKALALINHLDAKERLPELITECLFLRPDAKWTEPI